MLLIDDNKILLHNRKNTGWMDGYYDVPSGHLEQNETVRAASARELLEETGIRAHLSNLEIVHVMHCNFDDLEYFQFYVKAIQYEGEPEIKEPEKCSEMGWFPFNRLPENIVPYVQQALTHIKNNQHYSEYGWT